MPDIGDLDLTGFINGNNLLWLTIFTGGAATIYWRLRNYLTNKNKKYIEDTAAKTVKSIVDQLTNDNMVTELNFAEAINNAKKEMHEGIDKELQSIHECDKRIEEKLGKHDEKLTALDKTISVHIGKSEEKDKALDNVIDIVNRAFGIVKPIVDQQTEALRHNNNSS